ncbi:2Fe-2S iron-sulfur cluster-binding protein [Maritalea mediterranea]|uniref:2Fe-2S iron-sulfur cluster-binding protein n=1 Tax=Maritalea mediterranea TaxID=2909667 RepID=A0ABS9E3F2_9HYPH|nr:2Fe-2S iron-sulfur cluster-binding protein [Maritalea mediterranea]MCF4097403.1 2Fe-2S iron-sulfur cluster-binding protein [Maritalea mediterranea]
MTPKFHTLTISKIEELTPDARAISFALNDDLREAYAFKPGQYLTLRSTIDGKDVRRSYSVSSPLGCTDLTVGIRRVEDGVFSSFAANDLKVGDQLEVMTPDGRFVADIGGMKNALLIAAGSGITPMMSIAQSLLEGDDEAEVTLVYGNRETGTIMFREQLEFLKDRFMDRFTLIHILSREDQDVPILNGRIDADKIKALVNTGAIDPKAADGVFLCGPGEMIEVARQSLEGMGVAHDKIHYELFTPADGQTPRKAPTKAQREAAEQGVKVEVVLDGTTRSFTLSDPEDTVLEAARKHGLELPFSCKGGMCCTCRCKVAKGSAEMDVNYSLEPWEIEAGFTLACQTRPTSDELTLDFDES